LGVPVIYVDSLPYLWATEAEIPDRGKAACYCAQKFPFDRLPLARPLRDRRDIQWIDPIVPRSAHRRAGQGVVVNVGGLHSRLAGDTVDAYLHLILFPLIADLEVSGRHVSAVCGNLPSDACRMVRELLPGCRAIGRQSPYDFERLLRAADLLVTSPGSTTILQALSLGLPALLLPPQNLSQMLNAQLFSAPGAARLEWPASVLTSVRVDELRPLGEDAVLTYIYESISTAATSPEAAADVAEAIRAALRAMPAAGVLDSSLSALGTNGAAQVAQLIKQAMLAPLPRVE
ncbi:MAG: glycosyltransferase, partial [Vicinamibacterales bacterium]